MTSLLGAIAMLGAIGLVFWPNVIATVRFSKAQPCAFIVTVFVAGGTKASYPMTVTSASARPLSGPTRNAFP